MEKHLLPANITIQQFRSLLTQYDTLLENISSANPAKPAQKSLLDLDRFRYQDAVKEFSSPNPRRPMTHDDVKTLVYWKLRHGKFRPTLMSLVASNDPELVKKIIQDATKEYWAGGDAFKTLLAISKLRGIGPATASLLLSVHDPDRVIFFSDEAYYWTCCGGKKSPIKYSTKEYQELNAAAQTLAKRLEVNATEIEKVAYVLIKAEPSLSAKDAKKAPSSEQKRGATTMATNFISTLEPDPIPLADRFSKIKRNLIACNEKAVADSFYRLLSQLRKEADRIAAAGSDIVPTIDYFHIHDEARVATFRQELRQRGVAVIRRVIPPNVAQSWKEETQEYLGDNPQTKGFPAQSPQLYDMYWSPGQVRARADSRLLEAQRFAMSVWHSSKDDALVSSNHPVAYADRFRVRTPGDTSLATGPHVDNGSVERWEPDGHGRAGTYAAIFQGRWEDYDPWDTSARLLATSDLYNSADSCSMFRMFQGWLSLSNIAPGCGSLLVLPMLQLSTAYLLLRPFFSPRFPPHRCPDAKTFLHPQNWNLNVSQTSVLHGAMPGYIQELSSALHPHLYLARTMVPVPHVAPGDYVLWHPDLVHATDPVHAGGLMNTPPYTPPPPVAPTTDASVLYIPACPLTPTNALYLSRQRRAFLLGHSAPDFENGGPGERDCLGRPGVQDVADAGGPEGLRSMGLLAWEEVEQEGDDDYDNGDGRPGDGGGGAAWGSKRERRRRERELLRLANGILFPDGGSGVGFDGMWSMERKRKR
ncbi:DUF1479-domain-containing protein [Xylariomycetidae sp. FL2044]|nr:DUF1479-domain-containing protein [Xylariomycetidae sp. FL2044]